MSVPLVGSRYRYFDKIYGSERQKQLELDRKEALKKQQSLDTELIAAILKKNHVEITRLLEEGASPNATWKKKLYTACHLAANTNWSALRILLSYKSDRYRKDHNGLTPIYYAIKDKGTRRIAMLLDFPPELTFKCALTITSATEEEIKAYSPFISEDLKRQLRPDDLEDKKKSRAFLLKQLFSEGSHSVLKLLYAVGFDLNNMIQPTNPLDLVSDLHSSYLEGETRLLETLKVVLSYGAELEANSRTFKAILTKAEEFKCLDKALVVLAKAGVLTLRNTEKFTAIEICEWNNLDYYKKTLQEKDKPAPAPVNNRKRKRCRSEEKGNPKSDDDDDKNQSEATSINLQNYINIPLIS